MKLFPVSAPVQLEFDKIKDLLVNYCLTEYARSKAQELRIHTRIEFAETDLLQSHEYRQLLSNAVYFPNDYVLNLTRELKMLSIPGAVFNAAELQQVRKLADSTEKIVCWFDNERRPAYQGLAKVISNTFYEKAVAAPYPLKTKRQKTLNPGGPKIRGAYRITFRDPGWGHQISSSQSAMRPVFFISPSPFATKLAGLRENKKPHYRGA